MNKFQRFSLMTLLAFAWLTCFTNAAEPTQPNEVKATNDELARLRDAYLPAEFTQSNFTLDDLKRVLRQKCRKAAGDDAYAMIYEDIEQAAVQLMQCANTIANVTEVLAEVEQARPHGELVVVFQKYCSRLPQAELCLCEFNVKLLPCLTIPERLQNEVMMRIVTALLGFVCYKNGDHIALFIAEEGPECLEENRENISNCMNATYAAYLPKPKSGDAESAVGLPAADDLPLELPELIMGPKQCIDLHEFEECVLGYLEKCNEITPSNVIESLFRFVKNETKCQPEIEKALRAKGIMPRNGDTQVATLSGALALWLAVALWGLRKYVVN